MSPRSDSAIVAGRLAKIRDRVADRARGDLARHDAKIEQTREQLADLNGRRAEIDAMMCPTAGETLDNKSRTLNAWAGINLDRAIKATRRDLATKQTQRVAVQAKVRQLAQEAERAAAMRQQLEDDIRATRAKLDTRRLDAMATDRTLRKLRKVA